MSMPRFYVSPMASAGELPDDQGHHARDVLRLDNRQGVMIFDGEGQSAPARIIIEKKHCHYELTGPITVEPPPPCRVTIATAVPKADRSHQLLEQISQLGAAALVWLDCRYSVVHPVAEEGKMEKWRRLAVESARQCGRNRLLVIKDPQTPRQFLARADLGTIIWTHVDAKLDLAQRLVAWRQQHDTDYPGAENMLLTIMIGPEGGWSPEEQDMLGQITAPVRLGENILRIETAAAAAAAIAAACLPTVGTVHQRP
jgi:16S rRNA (uracil1498-N3)-methyltransferase